VFRAVLSLLASLFSLFAISLAPLQEVTVVEGPRRHLGVRPSHLVQGSVRGQQNRTLVSRITISRSSSAAVKGSLPISGSSMISKRPVVESSMCCLRAKGWGIGSSPIEKPNRHVAVVLNQIPTAFLT
jgi:hypothetical protein